MFLIGGINGTFSAAVPVDFALHDTYFVVAHIHYVLFGGSVFAVFSGLYYWFPKMWGRRLNERLGQLHFALMFIGFNLTFFPMHLLGLDGMPRRIATYPEGQLHHHLHEAEGSAQRPLGGQHPRVVHDIAPAGPQLR
jgi:cytochrome c oxidase subunit 1